MNAINEYGYFSKEVALKVDINASTLRQWCLLIEKEGYEFTRNDKEQRIFYERDINLLFEIKKQIEKTRNREDAIKTVVSRYLGMDNAEKLISVREDEHVNITISADELKKMIEESVATAVEKEREAMFKAFENKMNDVIERRDMQLVKQLNDSMEQKKLETAAAIEEEKKKGFWKRVFGG